MRRSAVASIVVAICLIGACRFLLPERYAVNAPLGHMLFGKGGDTPSQTTVRRKLHVPTGLSIGVFAGGVPNARMLRFTPAGDLLVSNPRNGSILLLEPDRDGDGLSDGKRTVIEGLQRPHGLDFQGDWLYVAETDGVGRVPFDAKTGRATGPYERVVEGLPSGGNHWSRTLRFGPDGLMYVSVGSSCNVCEEEDPLRATMLRFQPDGSGREIFARGLRNSVGFDWQPGTGNLYATDNGRDMLGDDFPPCELNHVVAGGFYGWPYANGNRVPDPDLGAGHESEIAGTTPPAYGFGAHNAPLGIAFVQGGALGADLDGAAIVALHGSWNRTRKDGYKVVSLHWGADGSVTERDFVTGFLEDDAVIGRPVDVVQGPDGALYVSDDFAGAVYRVWREGAGTETAKAATEAGAAAGAATGGDVFAALAPAERDARAARGRALYAELACATCHDAASAQRGMVTVKLAGLSSRYTPASLAEFLASPTPPMPAVERDVEARRDLAVHLLGAHP
jgi:glucose/arabinose dehydrogenase